MGIADSIFKPHPPNFEKSDIFWRSINDITIILGNFHCNKSLEKRTQAIRPSVEESLPRIYSNVLSSILTNYVIVMQYDEKLHFEL